MSSSAISESFASSLGSKSLRGPKLGISSNDSVVEASVVSGIDSKSSFTDGPLFTLCLSDTFKCFFRRLPSRDFPPRLSIMISILPNLSNTSIVSFVSTSGCSSRSSLRCFRILFFLRNLSFGDFSLSESSSSFNKRETPSKRESLLQLHIFCYHLI